MVVEHGVGAPTVLQAARNAVFLQGISAVALLWNFWRTVENATKNKRYN
jgi:hypothetical protein